MTLTSPIAPLQLPVEVEEKVGVEGVKSAKIEHLNRLGQKK
jgi:hypothetical protein